MGIYLAPLLLAACATQPAPSDHASAGFGAAAHGHVQQASAQGASVPHAPGTTTLFAAAPDAAGGAAVARPGNAADGEQTALSDAKPLSADDEAISHFAQRGKASWYGPRFHGKLTASGERFNMYSFTAAHRTLPLLSYVRVTNPENDRSVVVRINDRGPYKHHRIIDLSYAAARALGLSHQGTGAVVIHGVPEREARAQIREEKLASR